MIENSLGMKLVRIEAGEFRMGSESSDSEKPIHIVRITKPFLIGQTEVTQAQFEQVMGHSPWRGKDSVEQMPTAAASCVTWDDAVAFCSALTEAERRTGRLAINRCYRLPTEAEWEYACRAGTETQWSCGDDESQLRQHAWYDDNAYRAREEYAHKVGEKKENPWHLSDMHGNVVEWCQDWYDETYYEKCCNTSPISDPLGPTVAGVFHARVTRGGAWINYASYCRSSARGFNPPYVRMATVGFRVLCELE